MIKKQQIVSENEWQNIFSNKAKNGGEDFSLSGWSAEGLDAYMKYFLAYFRSHIKTDNSDCRVLDIGCGPGTFSRVLSKRGFKVCATDYSEEMIKQAKARTLDCQIDFQVSDIYHLPYPDNYFDKVLCMGVIQVLENPLAAISEIKRVLKPGGIMTITTLNLFSLSRVMGIFIKKELTPKRFYPYKFRSVLEGEGFHDIDIKGIYFFPKKISFLTDFIYKYKIYNFLNKFYIIFNFLSNTFQIEAKK